VSFETVLLSLVGDADDVFDIRASTRRCFYFDFKGAPTRLWDGVGVLHAGGHDWIGTIDDSGTNHLTAPNVQDTRDGTSPQYQFSIPRLDAETNAGLRLDRSRARGRSVTCYHVIIQEKEGMRPAEGLRFAYRLTMQDVKFSEATVGDVAGPTKVLSATVMARSGEVGRSRTPDGSYTDTSQRERARLLGVSSDSFCSFIAGNSVRTLTIEGN
jgi:hypothetical protein